MDQVHVIRHKVLVEQQSIRQVARDLGLSRNTVVRYLTLAEPRRLSLKPRPSPLHEKVDQRIRQLMDEWRPRTTRKQRPTGSRLHRQLIEEGFTVGKTTVYDCLRELRRQAAEVFIPLIYQPGEVAQIDFFEVTVQLDDTCHTVWKFVCRLMYSGFDFVWLYRRCDQLSFLDAHVRAFTFFNGIPARCVYDNLSAAVSRRAGIYGIKRHLTERFAALCSHYLFEPCFARPGEGHDKGGVESRGRGIRLQHLTPVPQGHSLAEIAMRLQAQITAQAKTAKNAAGESVAQRWQHEQSLLRPLPATPFEARLQRRVPISSRATVQIDGAIYSVPSHWARLEATALIGVDEISLQCQGATEVHPRQPKGGKSIRYRHYLNELAHKPQALRQVAPALLAELGEPFAQLWQVLANTHGELEAARVLARLLAALGRHDEQTIHTALEQVLSHRAVTGSTSEMTATAPTDNVREIHVPAPLQVYRIEAARASDYDWLLTPGERL